MRYLIAGLAVVGLIIVLLAGINGAFPSGSAKVAASEPADQGLNLTLAADAARQTVKLTQTVAAMPGPASPEAMATFTPVGKLPSATALPGGAAAGPAATSMPAANATATPDPAAWKDWPEFPAIPNEMRAIYAAGWPRVRSIPTRFPCWATARAKPTILGLYENNPELVSTCRNIYRRRWRTSLDRSIAITRPRRADLRRFAAVRGLE